MLFHHHRRLHGPSPCALAAVRLLFPTSIAAIVREPALRDAPAIARAARELS